MSAHDIRDIAVTVKMSAADFELIEKTVQILWPGVNLSRSNMLLTLAKLGVQYVQAGGKPKKSS